MPLQIFNSLSGKKEDFNPVHEGQASLYVCGPTVYGDSHLGHAKAYISFDIILRYLRYCGLKTFYVQNITDVGHLMGDGDDGERIAAQRAVARRCSRRVRRSFGSGRTGGPSGGREHRCGSAE